MLRAPGRAAVFGRFAVPAIGLLLFGVFGLLYVNYPLLYQKLLTQLIKVPYIYPFVDWEWIPSTIECWTKGIDVYVNVPCWAWHTVGFNYSPIWLRFTFLEFAKGWTNTIGGALGVLFFLSLSL